MKLTSRVAVITGGSMGIGEAIAKCFADEGARVVITSRDQRRAEEARARIGAASESVAALACDVRRRSDLEAVLAATLQRFGRLDIWVNNAGHGLMDSIVAADMANVRELFDTNFFSVIEAMQLVVPVMKRQGEGTIMNIASVAGHIAVPYSGFYSATKFAMRAISYAARVELINTGVHVMSVCPGFIRTDFAVNAVKGNERMRLGAARRGIPADRVARAVLWGYLRRKREIVVPWRDRLVIKLYQTLPGLVEYGMARIVRPAEQVIAERQAARGN